MCFIYTQDDTAPFSEMKYFLPELKRRFAPMGVTLSNLIHFNTLTPLPCLRQAGISSPLQVFTDWLFISNRMYDYNFVLLVGDKAAALTGLRVGLRKNREHPLRRRIVLLRFLKWNIFCQN